MALDTRNKRASACFPLMPWRAMLPAPDGAINQGDRQQVVFLYSGILAGGTVADTGRGAIVPLLFQDTRALIPFRERRGFVGYREKRAVTKG